MNDLSRAVEKPPHRKHKPTLPPPSYEKILVDGTVIQHYGKDTDACTVWERRMGVDVLGPNWEPYNRKNERIVLDWDDTCKDTGKYWILAHREVLQSFGFSNEETSDDAILSLFGNIHVAHALGLERFVRDGKQYTDDDVWAQIKNRAREMILQYPMDPLLIAALRDIKEVQGAHLAVWSSSPRELIIETVRANGVEDLFDIIVSVDDVEAEKYKPHPFGLLKAIRAMDTAKGYLTTPEYTDETPFDPNGVWMIGDSFNDILGGKEIGISTLWLEHPLQGHGAHTKRQKTFDTLQNTEATSPNSLAKAIEKLRPTFIARTFDPEEAGFPRNTSIMDIPPDTVRSLSTVTINFVKFLSDPTLRAGAYRLEQVRAVLREQGVALDTTTHDVVASLYGKSTTPTRTIPAREPLQARDQREAQQMLTTIIDKRKESIVL